MQEKIITSHYLREHPDHVFVFGDNTIRKGKKGAAVLRDEPNSYGFITKKFPSLDKDAYYKPNEYKPVFDRELSKLCRKIEESPDKKFLISKLGANLANKYGIYERVIRDGIRYLERYPNVEFLYEDLS